MKVPIQPNIWACPWAWSQDGERLALQQMLSQIRQDQGEKDHHMEAVKAADENCRISLFNMKESGKESCPGVF